MSVDKTLTEETFADNGVRTSSFIKDNNPFYNTTGTGGYSTCIVGSPSRAGANTLCNCVGLAWGAFNESWQKGSPQTYTKFTRSTGDAETIIDKASSVGLSTLPVSSTPPVGGLIVWGGTANHVAYISEVHSSDSITIIQSGYDTPSWTLRNNANTGWVCDSRVVTRNQKGTNVWGYRGTCLGFVINPGISTITVTKPSISLIQQTSATTIRVQGSKGTTANYQSTKIYVKWNSSSVSSTNYDLMQTVTTDFVLNFSKPREATSVSILPVTYTTSSSIIGAVKIQQLTASIPCINVCKGSTMLQGIPYIFTQGQWKKGVPTLFTGGKWYTIYNDKK